MTIHLIDGDIHLAEIHTRMPFKYGIATMTRTPHAFVRVRVEVDGQPAVGVAADNLPPKWFTKDPARALDDEVDEMLRVIEHALRTGGGLRGGDPFAVWRQLWDAQAAWGRDEGLPPLLSHFGTSLVERAMLDGFCRARGRPFGELLRGGELGVRPGELHPVLRGRPVADLLPVQPLARVLARHTVGLADPLVDDDIPTGERLDDGLPQSLAACIRAYGLRHFKIKVSGDLEKDRDRLERIAAILATHTADHFVFSLDGNEQFHTADAFVAFWETLSRVPELGRFFLDHLSFIEQPFHRDVALDRGLMTHVPPWPALPPLIIDESDGDLDSLPRALNLGYAGTSHKNCKGVFKGVVNACLLADRRQRMSTRPVILSGEDLVNIGPVALLQDLAVCANLGITSVERNGHHYVAGLSQFPEEVQRQILESHGDLYHPGRDGWPTLTIRDGALAVQSLLDAPFGVRPLVNVEAFPSPAARRGRRPT